MKEIQPSSTNRNTYILILSLPRIRYTRTPPCPHEGRCDSLKTTQKHKWKGENKEPLYDDDVSLTVVGSDLKFQDYDKWRPYYPGDNDEEVLFENHHDVNATVDELTAPLGSSTADANIRNNSEIRGSSDLFEHMEILPDNPLPFLDNILPDYNYEVDLSSQYEDDYVSRKSDDFTENTIDSTNETCPSHRCRCVCEDKFL